jgi:hypothetical protein
MTYYGVSRRYDMRVTVFIFAIDILVLGKLQRKRERKEQWKTIIKPIDNASFRNGRMTVFICLENSVK